MTSAHCIYFYEYQTTYTMTNNTKGLLGLAALAAGALGFWKYKNLTPEQKESFKEKANEAGTRIKETYDDLEHQVNKKIEHLREALEKERAQISK